MNKAFGTYSFAAGHFAYAKGNGSFVWAGNSGAAFPTAAGAGANTVFINNIRGVTTGNAKAINVLIDSAGQLGTVSSSIRYKENIKG